MGFLNPQMFLLMPFMLAGAYLLLRLVENVRVDRLAQLGRQETKSNRLRIIGPVLLLFLALCALTRPHAGFEEHTVPTIGRDIMLLIDISLSMQTEDIAPNRLEATKRKVQDIITWVSRNSPGDRIGITLFAGESHLFCPLTSDYGVAQVFARSISSELITSGGSGIQKGFTEVARVFAEGASGTRDLILISDGEDSKFNAENLPTLFQSEEIRTLILGVGTPEGQPIMLDTRKFLRDRSGELVISKLNEEMLRELSKTAGGEYQRLSLTESDFTPFLQRGAENRSEGSGVSSSRTVRTYHELGPLITTCILCGILMLILTRHHLALMTILTVLMSTPAYAQDPPLDPHTAYRAYEQGDYEAAYMGFKEALATDPGNLNLLQALGSAAFKRGKFDEARDLFEQLAAQTRDREQKFDALYNQGNSLLQSGKFADAIKQYDESLKLRPDDTRAITNRSLAYILLEEQKRATPTPTPTSQPSPSASEQSSPTPSPSNQPEDSHEKQSEQNSPQEKNQEGAETPSPSETKSEEEKSSEAEPEPTDAPAPQPTAGETPSSEPQETPAIEQSQSSGEMSEEELKKEEAQAWLESLPDAPVLLRTYGDRNTKPEEQYW